MTDTQQPAPVIGEGAQVIATTGIPDDVTPPSTALRLPPQPAPAVPTTSVRPSGSGTDKTPDEIFEGLNGFEEIAIGVHFEKSIATLAEHNETIFLRALLFTELVRGGTSPKDAKHEAMHRRLRDVKDFFAEDVDDVLPDDPDSASGKGDSPRASEPTSSPPSASSPASTPGSTRT